MFDATVLTNPATRERRRQALDILTTALQSVNPAEAIHRTMRRDGNTLFIGERSYRLDQMRRLLVVGAGKAGGVMAAAVEEILGDRVDAGLVITKEGHTVPTQRIRLREASHPVPDQRSVAGAQEMVALLKDTQAEDLVLCLLSGGGSALLTLPVPGITLEDKQRLTSVLLRSGATINQLNAVRKHLSQVKGGQLARLAQPAPVVSLILSDVVGNPLDVIASGPTVPDPTTFADALDVLAGFGLLTGLPPAIISHLEQGAHGVFPDTPKAGDPAFDNDYPLIIADNRIAALAAVTRARELGFNAMLLSTFVEGEAREVGRVLAGIAKEIIETGTPLARPACIVAGGETTVTIRGQGKGGRNQELALAAALALDGWPDGLIAALGTDGTDGPTDAAGALADGQTVARAHARGLHPATFLANNDAYTFFQQLGDLLISGPTGTNVNDLILVMA